MPLPETIGDYLRAHSDELESRILDSYAPLHSIDDPPSSMISKLLRKPYPAQALAIMDLVRRWQQARAGALIAECGTGKTRSRWVQSKPTPRIDRLRLSPWSRRSWSRSGAGKQS